MDDAARNLEDALELADLAERMARARLRREQPDASFEQLELSVLAWLRERPGAEHGDADGTPVAWPLRKRA